MAVAGDEAAFAAAVAALDPDVLARLNPSIPPDPGYVAPQVAVADDLVRGPHGDVPVRVYRTDTDGKGPRPLLVWCHGGGWTAGDLDMPEADATSREVCARSNAVVVSVDYRLANDGVCYPVPLDDVVAAWNWALTACASWGTAPDWAVLGGASAGGNLAAGAALRLRDEGGLLPSALVLVYPALHAVLPDLDDVQRGNLGINQRAEELFRIALARAIENYQGVPVTDAPSYVAPAAANLAGLPSTLIVTCEYDVLRISGEEFARSLETVGVTSKVVRVSSVGHGHINSPWMPEAQETYMEISSWVSNSRVLP